jgi:hypothetical protein
MKARFKRGKIYRSVYLLDRTYLYMRRGISMWIITCYVDSNISMFEFKTEQEAREKLKDMKGYNVLSEVVYFNDPCFLQEIA